MQNKMWLWVLIVIIVVAVFAFITSKGGVGKDKTKIMQAEGVKITILKEGIGDTVAKSGDLVSMNYTGRLTNGTVFDSNIDPQFKHVAPLTFTLGDGKLIKGWENGTQGMKVGEKRLLEIEPAFAYGDQGIGPIPPNSTLIFEVELLSINTPAN